MSVGAVLEVALGGGKLIAGAASSDFGDSGSTGSADESFD